MTKPSFIPFGLITPVLAEDLADGVRRSGLGELTWLRRPEEEPTTEDEPTGEAERL